MLYGRLPISRNLSPTGREFAEIEFQRIALVQCQLVAREVGFEVRNQIAVEFHGVEMRHAREQFARQRARARPDLDHVVAGLRRQCRDDAPDDIPIVQEMLAEALFG